MTTNRIVFTYLDGTEQIIKNEMFKGLRDKNGYRPVKAVVSATIDDKSLRHVIHALSANHKHNPTVVDTKGNILYKRVDYDTRN